ncbi:ferrous iron transport protein A [Candidatus Aerophobetes bacterium]|nr:ferrous iron transport protein A [Candidatus Aerophobetes bacterium]
MIPLSMVNPGQKVQIVQIRGGRGLVSKLANMGFYPGVIVEVISNRNGPLIVAREGIRLGLGFGMAHKILVRPLN